MILVFLLSLGFHDHVHGSPIVAEISASIEIETQMEEDKRSIAAAFEYFGYGYFFNAAPLQSDILESVDIYYQNPTLTPPDVPPEC
jgi:hypothetical protein